MMEENESAGAEKSRVNGSVQGGVPPAIRFSGRIPTDSCGLDRMDRGVETLRTRPADCIALSERSKGLVLRMCTAYELGKQRGSTPGYLNPKAVAELLLIKEIRLIRPTNPAPVIKADGTLATMSWGFRRAFAAKVKGKLPVWRSIVNSREDKLDGRTWKEAFALRRCLIPASSFFEWVEMGGSNIPLRFERPGGERLWIAGIWESNEEVGECFSMITTEPNAVMVPVHDRMPAVLTDEQIAPFMEGELNAFGPSAVALQYQEAANFLKSGKPSKPAQDELF